MDEVYLVEGYMDVIGLYKNGIENTVANLGTALTSKQIQILYQFYNHIIICFDGDQSGYKAALRAAENIIDELDLVLLKSVNPGLGGQKFISNTLNKIKTVRDLINASGKDIDLEVDGGINLDTIADVYNAGANVFVAGSAIFGSENYEETINDFRDQIS